MILGDRCTRDCAFCNVGGGAPLPPDPGEPEAVARAVAELGLRHAVVTSVTRDDLPDGGASHFARLTQAIRAVAPDCKVELLIPDLQGDWKSLETILAAEPDILGHNLETVPRLYPEVRRGASYKRSLALLSGAGEIAPQVPTKSGLMLGMEETRGEIVQVMADLLRAGCSLLTLGQYLAPTLRHHPVTRFVSPEEFDELREEGLRLGFAHVESGPLVRSSYHAEEQFEEARHERG
jgi:lipoic acid synthetase